MRRAQLALALVAACSCHRATGDPPADAAPPARSFDAVAIARAEDTRRAKDVPTSASTSHDVAARRRSARALARIADTDSQPGLARHLADEDPETAAWAAYGLGQSCKGREDAYVPMLAARGASLPPRAATGGSRTELDPHAAVARAIGRCAGTLSERVLVSLLGARGAWTEPALLGLGDLAVRKKRLGPEATTALLDAAAGAPPNAPLDLAFYALARADVDDAFERRVVDVSRIALGRPGDARILAIRAIGRAGKQDRRRAADVLRRVVVDAEGFDAGERAEAARALAGLAEPGRAAIAAAIAALTPDAADAVAITDLAGAQFHVLYTLLGGLGEWAPKGLEPSLSALTALRPPAQPRPGFARRLAELRCSAALALARGAYDAGVLAACDDASSEIAERARLASVLRRPLVRDRLTAFKALAASEHLRVREEAIEALGARSEVGEAAAPILARALASKHAGLVATAASVLHAHPDRAMVLAASERRAALDPRAPPPTANPARELAPAVAEALTAALAERWPEDRFETRIALVEAAAAVRHPQAKEAAALACGDPNPVVRERAAKALRTLGAEDASCDEATRELAQAAEIGASLERPSRVVLSTDAGELTIVLEPELSPIAATRLTSLVRSGFYEGIVVHRVVPGFVVQLGDPDGDGYGGSGTSLRCETSPVPFGELDVGMALAGRDTGSSQLFVTLSRTPHLDGEYTRVGRAEGDWASVAQGDVITGARIE